MHCQQQIVVWMPGLLALLAAASAFGQPQWFTIEGDLKQPAADVIQVDIRSLSWESDHRSMALRVSRATPRSSEDGVPYRSYTANVIFDCVEKTARYKSLDFYLRPVWQGAVHKTSNYMASDPQPMRFLDSQPNPLAGASSMQRAARHWATKIRTAPKSREAG